MKNGKELKKIIFEDTHARHAQLRVRLRHDGLTQGQFFTSLVAAYLDGSKDIMHVIDALKARLKKHGKHRNKTSKRLRERGQEQMREFGLSATERDRLFDLIAEEYGDL